MAWEKSPAELVDRFAAVLDRHPELERRKMFGYPAAFLGGHMVTGLHQNNWIARVGDLGGAQPFEPMAGRPMKGFAVVPGDAIGDDTAIEAWLERAIANVRTLPPKK